MRRDVICYIIYVCIYIYICGTPLTDSPIGLLAFAVVSHKLFKVKNYLYTYEASPAARDEKTHVICIQYRLNHQSDSSPDLQNLIVSK